MLRSSRYVTLIRHRNGVVVEAHGPVKLAADAVVDFLASKIADAVDAFNGADTFLTLTEARARNIQHRRAGARVTR